MSSKTMSKLHFKVNELRLQADAQRQRVNERLAETLERDGVIEGLADPAAPGDGFPGDVSDETLEFLTSLEEFQQELGPIELPDFDRLQRFLLWLLAHSTSRTFFLESSYRQRGQQGWVTRRRRETATKAAYEELVKVRGTVSLALDPRAAASILDLEGDTPQRTFQLLQVLPRAIRRMRDPATHFPELRVEGLVPEWETMVRNLEAVLKELVEAHRAWVVDRGRIHDGRKKRRRVLERYRRIDSSVRHLFKGLALLADSPGMARDLVFRPRSKPTRSDEAEESVEALEDADTERGSSESGE